MLNAAAILIGVLLTVLLYGLAVTGAMPALGFIFIMSLLLALFTGVWFMQPELVEIPCWI